MYPFTYDRANLFHSKLSKYFNHDCLKNFVLNFTSSIIIQICEHLGVKLFGNSWCNCYKMIFMLGIMSRFICGKRNLYTILPNMYGHDCLEIFFLLFFCTSRPYQWSRILSKVLYWMKIEILIKIPLTKVESFLMSNCYLN